MATEEQSQPIPTGSASSKMIRSYSRHKTNIFIEKTYDMLEQNKFNQSVSWDDGGGMIVIKDLSSFVTVVLPTIFNHQNFQSFVRQLNLYNFKKRKYKNYQYVYCHPYFQHGRRDLLSNVLRQPIYKKKKAKVLHKEYFGAEEGAEQPIRKNVQGENPTAQSNAASKLKDIELENMRLKEELMQMKAEVLVKEDSFRKCSDRNLDLRWRMKIQATEAVMLLNQLKDRMPPTAFEIFKAQEHNNIRQIMDPPVRREVFEAGYKWTPNLGVNPDAMYLQGGMNDEQIDRHAFSNEFFSNPHLIRQNQIGADPEDNRDGYHLMNPLMRETRDPQNPLFLQRLDQNALKHYNVFFNGYTENK